MIDQDLLQAIQYGLLEVPDGGQNWPSGLWTLEEVLARLSERQNAYLKRTQILVTAATSAAVPISEHRVSLPIDWIATVTAVWRGNDGRSRDLLRAGQFTSDAMQPTWEQTNGLPLAYHEYDPPMLILEIAPAPDVAGVVDLLYVAMGTTPNGNGVTLTLPDEINDAGVKYGVLADLLSKEGRGQDQSRAAYCEQRFDLAVEIGRIIVDGWA
jgi:hypothetical protein